VAPEAGGLSIEFGDLGLSGDLEVYCQKAKTVTMNGKSLREGVDYQYDAQARKLTIPFQAASTLAIKGAESLFSR